jgi:hypothetical protein
MTEDVAKLIVWLVGAPILVVVGLAVLQGFLYDLAAFISLGWLGIVLLGAWLVGFPIFAWWVTRHDPPSWL